MPRVELLHYHPSPGLGYFENQKELVSFNMFKYSAFQAFAFQASTYPCPHAHKHTPLTGLFRADICYLSPSQTVSILSLSSCITVSVQFKSSHAECRSLT